MEIFTEFRSVFEMYLLAHLLRIKPQPWHIPISISRARYHSQPRHSHLFHGFIDSMAWGHLTCSVFLQSTLKCQLASQLLYSKVFSQRCTIYIFTTLLLFCVPDPLLPYTDVSYWHKVPGMATNHMVHGSTWHFPHHSYQFVVIQSLTTNVSAYSAEMFTMT